MAYSRDRSALRRAGIAHKTSIMDFRHLRAFLAVADESSITRAARRLNISQPPLSRHIQQLEQEIGVTLFIRRPRGVELTVRGRALLDQARRLHTAAETFLETARSAKRDLIGIVRLGVPWGLWEAINRIRGEHARRFPGVEIKTEDLAAPWEPLRPRDAFRLRRVDITLARSDAYEAGFESATLFHEQMVVLLSEDHPLAARPSVRLAELANETLLLYDRDDLNGLHDKTLALYAAAGVKPHTIDTEGGPIVQAGWMLVASRRGIYMSVGSPYTWSHRASGVIALPLDEPNASVPVQLLWRKRESSQTVLNLVNSARAAFPQELALRRA
jgi:DNA-binding transcriptional LysR family regulator